MSLRKLKHRLDRLTAKGHWFLIPAAMVNTSGRFLFYRQSPNYGKRK